MDQQDPRYIVRLREGLSVADAQAKNVLESGGSNPRPGSIADTEHKSCTRPESIITICGVSSILFEYSAEHLSLLRKALVEPIEPLACLTCVRSMLEACSLIVWLSDPRIAATERLERAFAYRYDGQLEQRKYANSGNAGPAEMAKINQQMTKIVQDGVAAGCQRVQNRDGKEVGVGARMPSATELIKDALGDESVYRSLSAVAHGQSWALVQLGFQRANASNIAIGATEVHAIRKFVNVEPIWCVGCYGVKAFAKSLWTFGQYVGWDRPSLAGSLDNVFDKLQLNNSERFWR